MAMNQSTKRAVAAVAATWALGASLALGFVTSPVAPAGTSAATASADASVNAYGTYQNSHHVGRSGHGHSGSSSSSGQGSRR